jgi:hypothetical protein
VKNVDSGQKNTLWQPVWLQNEKIVHFSPFSTNYFPLLNFGKHSLRATHVLEAGGLPGAGKDLL